MLMLAKTKVFREALFKTNLSCIIYMATICNMFCLSTTLRWKLNYLNTILHESSIKTNELMLGANIFKSAELVYSKKSFSML